MRLAVMQPYLFPYLGYYQLVNSADKFVLYDDVNYIKHGYINRNNILVSGKAQRFTIAVPGMSPNKKISELSYDNNVKKLLKTIEQSYRKAPNFEAVFSLVSEVLLDSNRTITNIAGNSIREVFDYLGVHKKFYLSSEIDNDKSLNAQDRLIEMAKFLECDHYVNSPGGRDLYSKSYFSNNGVNLNFINTLPYSYNQGAIDFVPNLSMIDVLMWNSKEDVCRLLKNYELK
ncbi:WbqC family protein [Vibrio sp. D404a]|uniref:WbqC family protein n=1 Tax=unclassified Vibrio TaxID=2614977 RepID=UPI0025579E16|nr:MULTISPECIES: WbqC family protein [unclassified Vibrio]MDK9737731.1 WbqC family protein [Vibrio sp. D404a]MDK9795333.1 WbqC family protein [Vibrio sp. D449a]